MASIKDDIDKKLRRTAEDIAANAVIPVAVQADDPRVDLANYPGAKSVVITRNGSIVVGY